MSKEFNFLISNSNSKNLIISVIYNYKNLIFNKICLCKKISINFNKDIGE